jgi:hypothetical protein
MVVSRRARLTHKRAARLDDLRGMALSADVLANELGKRVRFVGRA